MPGLLVSMPKKSYSDNMRLVYRVQLDDGTLMRLPAFSRAIKIPYPSLAKAISAKLATVGFHDTEFFKIIAEVRRSLRPAKNRQLLCCPTCNGSGKIIAVAPAPTEAIVATS